MQKFKTLLDGCNYQRHCPMCQAKMIINENTASIETKWEWSETEKQTTINWLATQHNTDIELSIQLESNSILSYKFTNNITPIYSMGATMQYYYPSNSYPNNSAFINGIYVRLNFDCERCAQYQYLLQIFVNLSNKTIHTKLNSETLYIGDNNKLHKINNLYAQAITNYSFYSPSIKDYKDLDKDFYQLPLVPFDVQNPHKTLERIKSLILYS